LLTANTDAFGKLLVTARAPLNLRRLARAFQTSNSNISAANGRPSRAFPSARPGTTRRHVRSDRKAPSRTRLTKSRRLSQPKLALTGTERYTVLHFDNARNDPLNRLPVELVQDVFHQLPLLNAWHLQLVCRQWRTILGSHRFLASMLARHGRLPAANTTPFQSPDKDTIRQAIRQMQAERLGRPFSYFRTRVDSKERSNIRGCRP